MLWVNTSLPQKILVYTIPKIFEKLLEPYCQLFSARVWHHAQVLLVGAILSPMQRTVAAAIRVMGLSESRHFINYHRVLSRAVWSSRKASQTLLVQTIAVFAASSVIVLGLDDTIERRRGKKIAAKGIYRDPVRSSHGHFVKASGLRWLSLMVLVNIPWAGRVWALPFLTVLAPSERFARERGHRHKSLTDWARQMLLQVWRWLPHRQLVVVADSSFAALELLFALSQMQSPVHMVTRLRLDAALYQPPLLRQPKQMGRPRKVGKRLPTLKALLENPYTPWQSVIVRDWYGHGEYTLQIASHTAVWYHTGLPALPIRWVLVKDPKGKFESQALLCTNLSAQPIQILQWFRQRWQVEVTFEEVRSHLGVETQRQWSEKAILRTTPALLALFSIVVILAHQEQTQHEFNLPNTAWYRKSLPTFADALALVRQQLWQFRLFQLSDGETDSVNVPRAFFNCWSDLLCYAA